MDETVVLLPRTGRRLLLELVVPGNPPTLDRPRVDRRGRVYDSPKNRAEKMKLGMLARGRMQSPSDKRIVIETLFFMETLRRVDGDNLQKLVWDALNEIVWWDDSQVVEWSGVKELDRENPRSVIRVWELTG